MRLSLLILLVLPGCMHDLDRPRPKGDAATLDLRIDAAVADAETWPPDTRPLTDAGGRVTKWVLVSHGTFKMGADPTKDHCAAVVEIVRDVTLLQDYYAADVEVTQAMFLAVMGYNPSYWPACADCPIDNVNWHEAAAYCNALGGTSSTRCYDCTGSKSSVQCKVAAGFEGGKIYSCPGYRLPTEAEWERAYRAGTSTSTYAGDLTNCLGQDPVADAIAWYKANSSVQPRAVAGKQPNAWGLYDMAGNVWEWVHDGYSSTVVGGKATNPVTDHLDDKRGARGGCHNSDPGLLRGGRRTGLPGTFRNNNVGFRCARGRLL